jgi:hypothetical protein
MGSAVLDLYMARHCIRAEVPMLQFARVKYLLDSLPTEFLRGHMQGNTPIADHAGKPHFVGTRDLAVRMGDVRLVHPIEEKPSVPVAPDERRERAKVNVAFEVDEWQVTGELYMNEQTLWLDFVINASGEFFPLTNAKVSFGAGIAPAQFDFLLVNTRRISAVYESP